MAQRDGGALVPGWGSAKGARPVSLSVTEAYERGRAVYNFRCYYCHGYSGDARTLAATYLDPPPRNFIATDPDKLSRAAMVDAVMHGKPRTGMQAFANTLSPDEIAWVVDFVRQEFITAKAAKPGYHTVENGWPDHERYAAAFPFARGEIAIDAPPDSLTPAQQVGLRLFMSTCITCHDRAKVRDEGDVWGLRPVSYPRTTYSHRRPDAISAASVYAQHDKPPVLKNVSAQVQEGQRLFMQNCAFCHGGDGTGKNWIGAFMEPPARDLTSRTAMAGMTRERLRGAIREGLPGTKMPAWKSVLSNSQIDAIIAYIDRAYHPVAN